MKPFHNQHAGPRQIAVPGQSPCPCPGSGCCGSRHGCSRSASPSSASGRQCSPWSSGRISSACSCADRGARPALRGGRNHRARRFCAPASGPRIECAFVLMRSRVSGPNHARCVKHAGIQKVVSLPYDAVLARLPDAFKAEGFAVLTQIDVRDTLAREARRRVPSLQMRRDRSWAPRESHKRWRGIAADRRDPAGAVQSHDASAMRAAAKCSANHEPASRATWSRAPGSSNR